MNSEPINVRMILALVENQIVNPGTKDSIESVFNNASKLEEIGISAKYAANFGETAEASIISGMSNLKNEDGTDDPADLFIIISNGIRFNIDDIIKLVEILRNNPESVSVVPVQDAKMIRAGVFVEDEACSLPSSGKSREVAWADLKLWATSISGITTPGNAVSTDTCHIIITDTVCQEMPRQDFSRAFYELLSEYSTKRTLDIRGAYKALTEAVIGGNILELPQIANSTLSSMRDELGKLNINLAFNDSHIEVKEAEPVEESNSVEFKK